MSREALEKINSVINRYADPLPRKKFTTLDVGVGYLIRRLSVTESRFGKCISAILEGKNDLKLFTTFLPRRMVDIFGGDIVEAVNKSDGKYTLTYLGQSEPPYPGAFTRALIRFDLIE
jgi:hypothetical protein